METIQALLDKLNQDSGNTVVSDEDFKKAEKEINKKMRVGKWNNAAE